MGRRTPPLGRHRDQSGSRQGDALVRAGRPSGRPVLAPPAGRALRDRRLLPRDLEKALFHHAVAARLFEAAGYTPEAAIACTRRGSLARALPPETAVRIAREAAAWRPKGSQPPRSPRHFHLAASARRRRCVRRLAHRVPLAGPTFEALQRLISGAEDLVHRLGHLYVYRSAQSLRKDHFAWELRRENGVEIDEFDADELRQLEPAFRATMSAACSCARTDTPRTR